jgi:prepilin-type N-terminal cleavage/methylation domain-containing protein
MKTRCVRRSRFRAFTLIELLVVIGLIALLAGGIGVAMKNKNPGSALRSAQSILVSTLSAARSQSVLNQVDAMILVQADPAQDNFLRSVKVVVQTATNATTWKEVGGEVVLPEGVYVVPPGTSVTGATLTLLDSSSTGRRSLFLVTSPADGGTSGLGALVSSGKYFKSYRFTSLGALVDDAGAKVTGARMLVAAGTQSGPTAWTLYNTSAVRGFSVSNYGVATVIGDSDSFNQ